MPGLLSLGRKPGRIRPSLDGLDRVLETIAHPQRSFRSILVVGTNGKGSTAVMLERFMAAAGRKTGLYTSPHLVAPTERLRCNGDDISTEALEGLVALFDPFPDLTYFEVLTAAAFVHFARSGVEVAILEAGMGGRWDATRLAASDIAGLTNVGTDHARWLGDSRKDIARDKGAALAAARTAVLGPGVDTAIIEHLGVSCFRTAAAMVTLSDTSSPTMTKVRWGSHAATAVELPFPGRHQLDNFHLAVALAVAAEEHGWIEGLCPQLIRQALAAVSWPGRCSTAEVFNRTVLLDGAHNAEGASALAAYLRSLPKTHNLVFSCLDDKPVEEMAVTLRPAVGDIAIFELDDERAMPLKRLQAAFPAAFLAHDAVHAVGLLGDPVVAAGSLRLVGELLQEDTR